MVQTVPCAHEHHTKQKRRAIQDPPRLRFVRQRTGSIAPFTSLQPVKHIYDAQARMAERQHPLHLFRRSHDAPVVVVADALARVEKLNIQRRSK